MPSGHAEPIEKPNESSCRFTPIIMVFLAQICHDSDGKGLRNPIDRRNTHMDAFDLKILDIIQRNCALSHAELGKRVSLSASAVRRRLGAMRNSGVIAAEVAILGDVAAAGITILTSVCFREETVVAYQAFRDEMRSDPHVLQCYSVAGQYDFMMIVAAPSLVEYERWGEDVLMANPAILRYDSYVTWSTVKFTTSRPVFATS